MKKFLLAAIAAAAILPAASFTAEAAAPKTVFNPYIWGGWYGLACDTNGSKLVIPKYGILLKNSSNIWTVAKNSIIEMKVWTKTGFQQYTITAPKDLAPGDSVRVAQPSGAFRCMANARVHRIPKKILTRS